MASNDINEKTSNKKQSDKVTCGIIMPISSSDGYPSSHWEHVRDILNEVIESCEMTPNLVSDADENGIIHNRIVTNIMDNPVVICDVSSKNPNVMFELGLRLAFDKAAIIIKDSDTKYSFDTAVIEHVPYPKDLRYPAILIFKAALKVKIQATYKASQTDPNYSTFLKSFVRYKASGSLKEVGREEFFIDKLERMARSIETLNSKFERVDEILEPSPMLSRPVNRIFRALSSVDEAPKIFDSELRNAAVEFLRTDKVPTELTADQLLADFLSYLSHKYKGSLVVSSARAKRALLNQL